MALHATVISGLSLLPLEEMTKANTKPGGVAGLFFFGLLAALVLLWRSMRKRIRNAERNLGIDEPTSGKKRPYDSADGSAGAGTNSESTSSEG